MKIAVITCHNQPDYIRAVTLRSAITSLANHETIVIKNRHTGVLRYPEMIIRLIALRISHRPDAYVITFRGYEILPFACLVSWPKTLIYDELINPIEWLNEPRPEFWAKCIPRKLLRAFYRLLLKRCRTIITDTQVHAHSSAEMLDLPLKKFVAIPVGTNEDLFKPTPRDPAQPFRVFYYANMLPLHGLDVVIKTAEALKHLPIEFMLVGGKKNMAMRIEKAQQEGSRIRYQEWLAFEKFPDEISKASLCLGGPFGNTVQAQRVITGKTYQFLACGAPVLIGKNAASTLFVDKNNCLAVPLGDHQALAAAIQWAYDHPKELQRIGATGQKLYQQHFSAIHIKQQVAQIFAA